MKKRSQKLFINDIIESIESIQNFIKDINYNDFLKDDKTKSAVIWKIEIMGEAVKNLDNKIVLENDHIPWSMIAKMRDKIIHGYFSADYSIIWETIKNKYPKLLTDLKVLLDIVE